MVEFKTKIRFSNKKSQKCPRYHLLGVPKKCHDFNRMSFLQLLTEPIVLMAPCSQHLSILIDKNSRQTLERFSHQRRKSKLSYFCTRGKCSQNLAFAASVAWNIVLFPGASWLWGMWAVSIPQAEFPAFIISATIGQQRSQTPEDYRWRTGICHFQAR